jgi:hypothetical protein
MKRPLNDAGWTPGDSPRIAVVIQHTAARAHLLPRLLDALGAGWHGDPQVVEGSEPGNPWTTYRACLDLANEFTLADPDAPTHLLIIQDDALPVARFRERVVESIALRPTDVVCLYVPQNPVYMGRVIHAAFGRGNRHAQLPTGLFTPLVAAVYPLALAADVLVWWETAHQPRHRRCDDAQIARWLRARRRLAQAAVPCLVEHDEATPSLLGLGRYKRTAALLASAE